MLYYQVAVGISLSLAAVTILSLILLIVVLLCEVRKKGGHQLSGMHKWSSIYTTVCKLTMLFELNSLTAPK